MTYDQAITDLVELIKADKSIMQPWKNYAKSDLLRVQAVIKMGQMVTPKQPPPDMNSTSPNTGTPMQFARPNEITTTGAASEFFDGLNCICESGFPARLDCPVHKGIA